MMLKDLCRKYIGNEGADNSERINTLEEKSVISADLKDALSILSDGFYGERSEERARIEQAGSRLNSLESEVKLVLNALALIR